MLSLLRLERPFSDAPTPLVAFAGSGARFKIPNMQGARGDSPATTQSIPRFERFDATTTKDLSTPHPKPDSAPRPQRFAEIFRAVHDGNRLPPMAISCGLDFCFGHLFWIGTKDIGHITAGPDLNILHADRLRDMLNAGVVVYTPAFQWTRTESAVQCDRAYPPSRYRVVGCFVELRSTTAHGFLRFGETSEAALSMFWQVPHMSESRIFVMVPDVSRILEDE
ncbi:hypothetical protein BDZ89DRAFT_1137172 [Hymenopellis radicata]|nr:hypothetical protein BDZ89DRAFT_1137172 [Hymenopellis radicata]